MAMKSYVPRNKVSLFLILTASALTTMYLILTASTRMSSSASSRIHPVLMGAPSSRADTPDSKCRDQGDVDNDCGDDIDLTSLNDNATSFQKSSHLLKPKDERNKSSVLSHLWNFNNIDDQLLFVYEKFLRQNSNINHTNAAIFRQELAEYRTVLNESSSVVMHQKNCRANGSSRHLMKTSPEFFKLLPKDDPIGLSPGKRFSSCAVIGNSGSILRSGCGKEIDEHVFVMRCNAAPLEPFKEDAGMRSDYVTMNPSIIMKKYRSLGKDEAVERFNRSISQYAGILSLPCFGAPQSLNIRTIKAYKGGKLIITCMNKNHFSSVSSFWKNRRAITKKISTGFYEVTTAIQLCDEVDLYGFWPFSSRFGHNETDIPYHYFDDISSVRAHNGHDMDKEFSILAQLHGLGVVSLHVGSCS